MKKFVKSSAIILVLIMFFLCLHTLPQGPVFAAPSGWNQEQAAWYYYWGDGTKARGWVKDCGYWYYLNPGSGVMQTGWVEDRGYWYYLNPGSGAMQTGWVEDRGYWYYLNPGSGAMQTGWVEDRGHWYYMNPGSGAMQTGWLEDRGHWYYLNPGSGAMQAGWLEDRAQWYYLDPDSGIMQKGWLRQGGSTYYLTDSGSMFSASGLQKIEGKLYYFCPDGRLDRDGRAIDPNKPMIAFSFDDGPKPETTTRIVNALKNNASSATFFVLGNRIDWNADLLRDMASRFEIANHSYSHSSLTGVSADEFYYQIQETDRQMQAIGLPVSSLLRPPYGNWNQWVADHAGKALIMWSVDTRDWQSRYAAAVEQAVLNNLHDGGIVLMHDLYPSTAEAVERLVPQILAQGYQIVSVSELMQAKGMTLQAASVYYSAR